MPIISIVIMRVALVMSWGPDMILLNISCDIFECRSYDIFLSEVSVLERVLKRELCD